jgi:hypothetical protein
MLGQLGSGMWKLLSVNGVVVGGGTAVSPSEICAGADVWLGWPQAALNKSNVRNSRQRGSLLVGKSNNDILYPPHFRLTHSIKGIQDALKKVAAKFLAADCERQWANGR